MAVTGGVVDCYWGRGWCWALSSPYRDWRMTSLVLISPACRLTEAVRLRLPYPSSCLWTLRAPPYLLHQILKTHILCLKQTH